MVNTLKKAISRKKTYIGSSNGVILFSTPGIKWEPDENGVIAFDCRNRKW